MKVKMILPSLTEAGSPFWRPIKYSLFPPLGLATLAGFLTTDDEISLIDEHVEKLTLGDKPDLVIIQLYITNAYRAYRIADYYRKEGVFVALGGLHVTTVPDEAEKHADAIFLGPGEDTFPVFLNDFRNKNPKKRYYSTIRSLENVPSPRRDLIKRHLYLVPNSIVVSRGCPHHCDFCYKDSFYKGGRNFYTQKVDRVMAEIDSLPGKHLYFLDDHLFADSKYASMLFDGMKGMNKVFQAAGTVKSVLEGDLIEKAHIAGLRSLFVGFETLTAENLRSNNKIHNLNYIYTKAIERLHSMKIMINASFVFGFDSDNKDVFAQIIDWAIEHAVTTATFHILTPYPGTKLYDSLLGQNRIITRNWDLYDTRHAVFQPKNLTREELETGYWWSYVKFYKMNNIFRSVLKHDSLTQAMRHLIYTVGWKKMELLWKIIIQSRHLAKMRPVLESLLNGIQPVPQKEIIMNDIRNTNIDKQRA